MVEVSDADVVFNHELDVKDAESVLLAREVSRALCLRRLADGLRRCGRLAYQLQLGRLSILFVLQDRDDLQRIRKRERIARHSMGARLR